MPSIALWPSSGCIFTSFPSVGASPAHGAPGEPTPSPAGPSPFWIRVPCCVQCPQDGICPLLSSLQDFSEILWQRAAWGRGWLNSHFLSQPCSAWPSEAVMVGPKCAVPKRDKHSATALGYPLLAELVHSFFLTSSIFGPCPQGNMSCFSRTVHSCGLNSVVWSWRLVCHRD